MLEQTQIYEVKEKYYPHVREVRTNHGDDRPTIVPLINGNFGIITHGSSNGYLSYDDIVKVAVNKFGNRIEFIHCCYPKQVAERYPELSHLILNKDWNNLRYTKFYVGNFVEFGNVH